MNILSNAGTITAIIIGVVLVVLIFWYIGVYNRLKQLNEKVNESESGIDVALQKRFDELTKMLDVTKGYAKHEAETLEKTIGLRSGKVADATMAEKAELSGQLDKLASGLNVVVERYPELKADNLFKNLQLSITDVEEHLQASRRLYNANVNQLNRSIIIFPNSIVASMSHIAKRDYFEAEDKKKEDPKMEF